MSVKQISIFVENKPGKLAEVTRFMAEHEINLRALSIADTQDFGILRIITACPDHADAILQEEGYLTKLNHVLAVVLPDRPGALADVLETLSAERISVEYTYAVTSSKPGEAYMVFRVDDRRRASEALAQAGIRVVEQTEFFA